MPLILGIAGLGLSAIFGITSLLDRLDKTTDDTEHAMIMLIGGGLAAFGIWLTIKTFKK